MCILGYAADNSYTMYLYDTTLMVSRMDCKLLTDSDKEKFGVWKTRISIPLV